MVRFETLILVERLRERTWAKVHVLVWDQTWFSFFFLCVCVFKLHFELSSFLLGTNVDCLSKEIGSPGWQPVAVKSGPTKILGLSLNQMMGLGSNGAIVNIINNDKKCNLVTWLNLSKFGH